jgi:hypothetical protein
MEGKGLSDACMQPCVRGMEDFCIQALQRTHVSETPQRFVQYARAACAKIRACRKAEINGFYPLAPRETLCVVCNGDDTVSVSLQTRVQPMHDDDVGPYDIVVSVLDNTVAQGSGRTWVLQMPDLLDSSERDLVPEVITRDYQQRWATEFKCDVHKALDDVEDVLRAIASLPDDIEGRVWRQ